MRPYRWNAVCVLLLLAWAGSIVGCATLKKVFNPARVYALTEFAAYNTACQLIRQDATKKADIERARDGFCQLAAAGIWNIHTAADIALSNGLAAFVSDEGDILIAGGLLVVDLFGPTIDLSSDEHAKAFVTAGCSGLTKAVAVSGKTALASAAGAQAQEAVWQDLAAKAKATRPTK
jgi:hypothetical protein